MEKSNLKGVIQVCLLIAGVIGIGLAVFVLFSFNIGGKTLYYGSYSYALIACFLPFAFLLIPMRKKDKGKLHWYNIFFAGLATICAAYLSTEAYELLTYGFLPMSTLYMAVTIILFSLILEAARRSAGLLFAIIVLFFGLYPIFADHAPEPFTGMSFSFSETMGHMILSPNGILGIPMEILGDLLIGFLLFASALRAFGGGDFFINLAKAILGKYRGGVAKVAVLSSAFFGSLSGSAIANVVSTGSFTIPAMKKTGYPAEYAGAVEACASTGGVLMPPVMGAIIFVMTAMLDMEYRQVMIAAFIPSILYYFTLLIQVDCYAAKKGIKGLSEQEIPSVKETLKRGWQYFGVLFFLVWGLLYMRWERLAPFYATGLLFLLSLINPYTRPKLETIWEIFRSTAELIVQTMAVLLPIGFVVAGLIATGTAGSLTTAIITLGKESLPFVLFLTVMMAFVFGMGGMGIAGYVILSVIAAPAIIRIGGLNQLAVHLFIAYYGMLALITPPVAVASFVAASIANSDPLRTALASTRLGIALFVVPIFFLFEPVLLLQGPIIESLFYFTTSLVGLGLVGFSIEGYLPKFGRIYSLERLALFSAGCLFAFPLWQSITGGFIAISLMYVLKKLKLRRKIKLF
jgi:TRAP transporter 4TM/12TM fusion protein